MPDRLAFLRTVAPFDQLPPEVQEEVAGLLVEVIHPRETLIYRQGESKLRGVDLIVSGAYDTFFFDSEQRQRLPEVYGPSECYGGVSVLLNKKRSLRTVRARAGTRVYFLHRHEFRGLCLGYEAFFHYFTSRYGQLMLNDEYAQLVHPGPQAPQNFIAADELYSRRMEAVELRPVLACPGHTPTHEVARLMARARTSCYFVLGEDEQTIAGYVTDITLRDKVVAGLGDARLPISTYLDAPTREVRADAFVYEALLLMFRTKTRYLLIAREGEYIGFISRNKLLAEQAQSPFLFIQGVKQAVSGRELRLRWQKVPDIVFQLLDRGVKPEIVNQVITTVADTIALKVIEQVIGEMGAPPARFIFVVLGSEGRQEQTLLTDQDNAIIYEDKANEHREEVRAYFLAFAEQVSDRLNDIGFSFCDGGLMAKNPKWTHSLSHWKRNYQGWLTESNPENVMRFAAFFDIRFLYGEAPILDELRDFLDAELQKPLDRFLHYMATNALQYQPPLTFFNNIRTFAVGDQQVINLKRVMSPIVDLVRVFALKNRVFATNTGQRLAALRQLGVFSEREHQELVHAYYYLMGMRLKKQAAQMIDAKQPPDNYLDPKSLTKVERVTLKEIFKVMEDFQLKIKVNFAKLL
ncbi:MAG: CBS domain-containing protein [Cytophagaceae bacterium]|nr:MAG: CBS domain-containing protein [Cytophagaceae bacterium]